MKFLGYFLIIFILFAEVGSAQHYHHYPGRGPYWHYRYHWYFYDYPSYYDRYPYTQSVIVAPSTQTINQMWYYCEPLKDYYPTVPTCPVPWKTIPATPPK